MTLTTSDAGASKCTDCEPNTHPDGAKEQCIADVKCYPGEYRTGEGSCAECPPGSFRQANVTSLINLIYF